MQKRQSMVGCILLLAATWLRGQQVEVGDKFQGDVLNKVVYYGKPEVRFDEYRGKNIILEFWSKTCAVCIKNFPRLLQLQERYGSKLQIIAINSEPKEETEKLLAKQKIPSGIIPFVTEDKVMARAFPRNYNPWVVWIDSSGTVRHISDGEWVNDENIQLFLSGGNPRLEENVFIKRPKTDLPLFLTNNEKWADKVVYYSYLSHCVKGLSIHNLSLIDSSRTLRITRNCKSAEELIKDAYAEGVYTRFGYAKEIVLKARDSYSFVRPRLKDTAWVNRYCYSYEISVSSSPGVSVYKMMQEDLQRLFNVTAATRKEKIQCPVLVRTDSVDRIASRGGNPANNFFEQASGGKTFIKNTSFHDFVAMLQVLYNPQNSKAPLIDGTGYKGNVDIEMDRIAFEKPDFSLLKKALNRYGLDIILRDMEREVLVIKEN